MLKNRLLNKRGNVVTLEFVILLTILTFFIFYPFALYSSYQTKDILSDIKDRGLQLVSTTGEMNNTTADSLGKEFAFYGLKPETNQKIIVTLYNTTKDAGQMSESDINSGKKAVVIYTTDASGNLNFNVQKNTMSKAYRKDQDIERMTIQYPSDGFLNSVLKMIGKNVNNTNDTGTGLAFKVSGFVQSEYVE